MTSSDPKRASNEHDASTLCGSAKRARIPRDTDSNTQRRSVRLRNGDYTVAWVCALSIEMAAARAMLDEIHESLPAQANDTNAYTLGNVGQHNIAVACLPAHQYGTINAAVVASNLVRSFPSIRVTLMVGIGGGVPRNTDLRLGDVVVGCRIMQYDLGKVTQGGQMERTGIPKTPPIELSTSVSMLRAIHELTPSKVPSILHHMLETHPRMTRYAYPHPLHDRLFLAASSHNPSGSNCDGCDTSMLIERPVRTDHDPKIHYGAVASGNGVMRDGITRDKIAGELDVICFEMEAAGLVDHVPCLVIRGICDYADSHKSKQWQEYAAATAAAYTKELLLMAMPVAATEMTATREATVIADPTSLQHHRKQLLDSLRFEQIDSRQSSIKAAHAKTCKWLLEHPTFTKWQRSEASSLHCGFLWISGKPGAGKSTIMKFACARVRKESPPNTATASFFFHARGEYLEKSTIGMHRSFLLQLLESFPDLQRVFDDAGLITSHRLQDLSIDILRELLRNAILSLGQRCFTCFIDALDECDEQQVRDMVEYFEDLGQVATKNGVRLRICFSSRHYPYIYIRGGLRLTLEDQQGHKDDLDKYVQNSLRADSSPLVDKIREQILEKAAGVFMWVVLVVDILNKEFQRGRLPAVQSRLEELPEQLSELFKDILQRDRENMDDLLLSIQWILYANRPLKPDEFYFAVWSGLSIEKLANCQTGDITDDAMDKFITSSSKGLAEVTKSKRPTVQFIHESVRDFLIKDNGLRNLWPEITEGFESLSHERLKQCCYAYIALDSSTRAPFPYPKPATKSDADTLRQRVLTELPFLEYATNYVLWHANIAARATPQVEFLSEFRLHNWIKLSNMFEKFKIRQYTELASLLYIMADKGFSNLIEVYIHQNTQINIGGGRYKYPLLAAVMNGHTDVVRALLEQDVSHPTQTDTKYSKGRTPLSWAAEKGHEDIVQMLIQKGADFTSTDSYGRTPLWYAAWEGHEAIVRMLVEKGADFASKDSDGRTPLSWAAESGNAGSVRILIEKGADFTSRDSYGRTPLSWAAEGGNADTVELLVEEGADIESRDANGRTPLSWAAERGSTDTVESLIEKGADVESRDANGRTPLSWAAGSGCIANALLLVDKGADIESRDAKGRTPLSWAAQSKYTDNVRLLVEKGANIESRDASGRTPLLWAAGSGCIANALLLVDKGADIGSRDANGRTLLSWAAEGGHADTVESLVEKGANIESRDANDRTPLSWAAERGSTYTVKPLVEKGADIESRDANGRTPLLWAAARGCVAIVQLLLATGADITSTDANRWTALSLAAGMGHQAATDLLIEMKADVAAVDVTGRTPLSGAAGNGHWLVAQKLIEEDSDIASVDVNGRTPLSWAAGNGHLDAVLELVKAGSDITSVDVNGRTPLSWAAGNGHTLLAQHVMAYQCE